MEQFAFRPLQAHDAWLKIQTIIATRKHALREKRASTVNQNVMRTRYAMRNPSARTNYPKLHLWSKAHKWSLTHSVQQICASTCQVSS
ncbi:hypothetical protein COOONC_27025 [Cooperia oncophora]